MEAYQYFSINTETYNGLDMPIIEVRYFPDWSLVPEGNVLEDIKKEFTEITSKYSNISFTLCNLFPIKDLSNFSIYQIICEYQYEGRLDLLPNNLKVLDINSWYFNERLDNLPDGLESLIIRSNHFNQPLDNLPGSLKDLTINMNSFHHGLDNLPSNLKILYLDLCLYNTGSNYEKQLDNLPNDLEELTIRVNNNRCKYTDIYRFPKNLKCLTIIYNDVIDQKINFTSETNKMESLQKLHLMQNINYIGWDLDNLPNNITYLSLDGFIAYQGDIYLPDKLETLVIRNDYQKEFKNIPANLQKVIINGNYQSTGLVEDLAYVKQLRAFNPEIEIIEDCRSIY